MLHSNGEHTFSDGFIFILDLVFPHKALHRMVRLILQWKISEKGPRGVNMGSKYLKDFPILWDEK